jgi:hypothetical protein
VNPTTSRIFVFNTSGRLLNEIGGNPGEELVGNGALLGLTIDKQTGDLYVVWPENWILLNLRCWPGWSGGPACR